MVVIAHCWVSRELIELSEHPGRGIFDGGLAIRLNHWMRFGEPVTAIYTVDVDYGASVANGWVREQGRLAFLPGHLVPPPPPGAAGCGDTPPRAGIDSSSLTPALVPARALATRLERHWDLAPRTVDVLSLLGRRPGDQGDQAPPSTSERCTCPIQTLMLEGCRCGQ